MHILKGESPYGRTTYRYTPFLAALLSVFPNRECGRFLFCTADALCGWIIVLLRRHNRMKIQTTQSTNSVASSSQRPDLQDALWWLYNPIAINICTRGSAESFVVLLPVLITMSLLCLRPPSILTGLTAGFFHGIAIHAKLYPVIYTLSFLTALVPKARTTRSEERNDKTLPMLYQITKTFVIWIRRLLAPVPIVFGVTSSLTFAALTVAAVLLYDYEALDEGLLYHFTRVDHRHNYSMHWYWIYLARAHDTSSMPLVGRLLLIPQLVLLLYTSLAVAPYRGLALAVFVQTFLFVALNKVITAQYFTWYLCLLPLCSEQLRWTPRVQRALLSLILAIVFWLCSAYCLEMQGMPVHRVVWMASMVFFGTNVNLLRALLKSVIMINTESQQEEKKSKAS